MLYLSIEKPTAKRLDMPISNQYLLAILISVLFIISAHAPHMPVMHTVSC